ncbi:MAG: HAD family hydrolase [Candidatus Eremiobacteraeota bacterium]|nr:HAD family hydrolase [Candidatus Eremiobacteraeota bacterium]
MNNATVGVGFDIDHTLCIDNKLERVAFLHLLEQIEAHGGYALGSLAEESENIDRLLATQRAGNCTIDEAVYGFVRDRGVAPNDVFAEGFRRMALSMAETFIVPDPNAKAMLDALTDSGAALGVLSNGWNPLQVVKARRAGFKGRVIASADLGVQKPHPDAFRALAHELGLEPRHCFYVGDAPEIDIAGALKAGFQAVWIDNEGKTYPPDIPEPTYVVHSLLELIPLVGAVAAQ